MGLPSTNLDIGDICDAVYGVGHRSNINLTQLSRDAYTISPYPTSLNSSPDDISEFIGWPFINTLTWEGASWDFYDLNPRIVSSIPSSENTFNISILCISQTNNITSLNVTYHVVLSLITQVTRMQITHYYKINGGTSHVLDTQYVFNNVSTIDDTRNYNVTGLNLSPTDSIHFFSMISDSSASPTNQNYNSLNYTFTINGGYEGSVPIDVLPAIHEFSYNYP